ncbi:RNA exonuclease 4-like isoform X2 [Acanthaster planci]|uniref:RNA exonuclease 4 n=1 Tax=Acanthaster planci TaxID=133434 RepID=A0A8B7XKG9_ACAPL|nr:RNA exonuclease 4-like isoform X2 [Acanthaster planci]
MGKRTVSGHAGSWDSQENVAKKKSKYAETKHQSVSKSSDGNKLNPSKKFRESLDTDSKKTVPTFWWHAKKVKKLKNEGQAGSNRAKAMLSAPPGMSKGSTVASPGGGQGKISKKKALQLKKKRQRKNRLLKKKLNSSKDAAGDLPRMPKTWGTSKHAKKTPHVKKMKNKVGKQNEGSEKTKPDEGYRTTKKAVNSSKPKAVKLGQDNTILAPRVSSQSSNLQKSGGQKERKVKKARKFKKANTSTDAIPATSRETGESASGLTLLGQDRSRNVKKAGNGKHFSDNCPVVDKDSSSLSDKTEMDKRKQEEVSSNWKALLPIVEKSKEADAKRRKKFGKAKKTNEEPKASKPDIWFDDVDPSLIRANENTEAVDSVQSETDYNPLIRKDAQNCPTKCLAMDCEMVGTGPKGSQSILARVSVVNQYGACIFDKYVKPREPVTDYRTFVSGIRPQDLRDKGEDFEKVQKELSDLLKGRVVVGHALHNDFKVLYFSHPRSLIRDTSTYQPFKDLFKSKRPGLRKLTELLLKVNVQKGEHNSIEDAQAAMKLYLLHRRQWEKWLRERRHLLPSKKMAKADRKTATEALV